jgi:hypothetical protein
VITGSARVAGTAIAGMKTQGIVVIVDTPKSGEVINPTTIVFILAVLVLSVI